MHAIGSGPETPRVDREQVLAFRFQRHNLARRLPAEDLQAAIAACGIRNTPPWVAPLSVAARVAGVGPDVLDRASLTDRVVLQTWSLRLTAFYLPAGDLAPFTAALWPQDEAAARSLLPGVAAGLAALRMPALEALERTGEAMRDVLAGRAMTKGELSTAVGLRLPAELKPWCDSCQTHHVDEALFCMLAYRLVFCFGARVGNQWQYVSVDDWLGPQPEADPRDASVTLLRRYLACCGPSTPDDFTQWSGMAPADARRAWRAVERDLVEVAIGPRRAWLAADDLVHLRSARAASEVRLVPPYDPFLLLRDRDTLAPGKAERSTLWRAVGNPGAVLVGGLPVGAWRSQSRGTRLQVTVQAFAPIASGVMEAIEAEAELMARARGSAAAEVRLADRA